MIKIVQPCQYKSEREREGGKEGERERMNPQDKKYDLKNICFQIFS